ncbi:MAG TPA: DUF3459 domain-containing protein, partial [Flavisolibacter sp.]|nr:DUF3459 domain-containing protein [Flavisolibacter sp.]
MQWNDSDYAGFSQTKPWLRLSAAYKRRNVEREKTNSHSHLCLYKRLIALRQKEPSLMYGSYQPVHADHQAMAYIREAPGETKFLIVLNLSHRPCYLNIEHRQIIGTVILSTSQELEGTTVNGTINLSGDEGIIVSLRD